MALLVAHVFSEACLDLTLRTNHRSVNGSCVTRGLSSMGKASTELVNLVRVYNSGDPAPFLHFGSNSWNTQSLHSSECLLERRGITRYWSVGLVHDDDEDVDGSYQGIQSYRSGIILHILRSVFQSVYWMIGIAEAATILANNLPSVPRSRQILSELMAQDNVDDLCLTPLSVTGMVLITLGILLRMRCFRAMKTFFTFDLSIHKNHRLVATGPYGIVRHPSYSGMLMVYVGMAFWYGSRGSWLRESGVLETRGGKAFFGMFGTVMGAVMVGLLRRMPVEDGALRKQFGREWDEYAHNVPYSLIPGVY